MPPSTATRIKGAMASTVAHCESAINDALPKKIFPSRSYGILGAGRPDILMFARARRRGSARDKPSLYIEGEHTAEQSRSDALKREREQPLERVKWRKLKLKAKECTYRRLCRISPNPMLMQVLPCNVVQSDALKI